MNTILVAVLLLADADKQAVPLYTNEDLARIAPFKGETGVASTPASPPAPPAASTTPADHRSEAHWRREAQRLEDRLLPLRDRIEDLRLQIAERQRKPGVRPYSDPQIESWQRRLRVLEERLHDAEDRFLERARRAGALPGWLR